MHHLPIAMLDFFLFAEESLGALAGMFLELLPLNDFRGGRDLKLILFLPFPSPPPSPQKKFRCYRCYFWRQEKKILSTFPPSLSPELSRGENELCFSGRPPPFVFHFTPRRGCWGSLILAPLPPLLLLSICSKRKEEDKGFSPQLINYHKKDIWEM